MSEGDKCGLGSILPLSCRGRAEAFARRLHSRLRSLGSQDGGEEGVGLNGADRCCDHVADQSGDDETSWLANNSSSSSSVEMSTTSQPQHHLHRFNNKSAVENKEVFFDFGLLESPPVISSEDEEVEGDLGDVSEVKKLINEDTLREEECKCPKTKHKRKIDISSERRNSEESDSDGPFYDTEEKIYCNGNPSRRCQKLNTSSTEEDVSISSQSYATTSECLPVQLETLADITITEELNEEEVHHQVKCNGDKIDEDDTHQVKCVVEITVNGIDDRVQTNGKNDEETDDELEEERVPRVRRCSSLKTGKTPPGTPGSKKIVRFADALGLDLADVRTFLDEIPKVPTSAYEDLSVDLNESPTNASNPNGFQGIRVDKILMPLFQQPGGLLNFLDLVRENQVCLENAIIDDPVNLSIKGLVRVRNLDFHKSVYVRYTLNSWRSFADVQATYLENSCDGFSDKFSFVLYARTLSVGQKVEFACRFQVRGTQYWDNNNGRNYCFQCLPATDNTPGTPLTRADEWGGASFY